MPNIWVLDDDKSIRWVFEKALEKAGLSCKTFANTNEAINQFMIKFITIPILIII